MPSQTHIPSGVKIGSTPLSPTSRWAGRSWPELVSVHHCPVPFGEVPAKANWLVTAMYEQAGTVWSPTAKRVSGFNPIRGSNPRTSAMTRGNAPPGNSPGGALWGLFGGLASFLVSVEAGAVPDTHGRQQACPARAEPNPANGPISCSWVWERSNGGLDAPIGSDRGHVGQSEHGRCQRVRSPCPPRVACTWCLWRGRGRGSVAR